MAKLFDSFQKAQSRILDQERSSVILQKEALFRIVLVFPNSYETGMSNLGFHALYRLLNSVPGICCERAFVDELFPEIRSLESGLPLNEFDMIAFSVAFEPDYINVIRALLATGLEPYSAQRDERDPIVLAGGVATFINPRPLMPFIDICFLGELEPVFDTWVAQLLQGQEKYWDKSLRLEQMKKLAGFYSADGNRPAFPQKRAIWTEPSQSPQYSAVISSVSHFTDMFLVEVGRGCGRFCSFCAASHVYHPVRFFEKSAILKIVDAYANGAKRVGLVGAALCDYPDIEPLCTDLVDRGYQLGLSSFRFEAMTPTFLTILERTGIQTITLAPEAGTERLRSIINKRITDQIIFAAIEKVADSSIQTVKLYFMIGLPFEQEEDIDGIVSMVSAMRDILDRSPRRIHLTVSINAFVPKPFTAFQWARMNDEKELKTKRRYVERPLQKMKGVHVVSKGVRHELLQGVISLGDKNIADFLLAMAQKSDNTLPDLRPWTSALIEFREPGMSLPWDCLHYPIPRERLWRQWRKLLDEQSV
jgi:radical SAM superfamily enzyme YgiQ (UPF0313 family)